MSKINVDTWEPESGTAMTLGAADSTITVTSGATLGKLHIQSASSGTIAPSGNADELVVKGSGHAGMSIYSGVTSAGLINFGDDGHDSPGQIIYDHNDNSFQFVTNTGERFRFASSGQLGIAGATYGSSGDVLTSGGASSPPSWAAGGGLFASYAIFQDQKASDTAGGTFTSGAWRTRDLNTTVANTDTTNITLGTNQFTLLTGSYLIRWGAIAYEVSNHQSRLYDVTGTAAVDYGLTNRAESDTQTTSMGSARVTVAASPGTNIFSIEHRCHDTNSDGFGKANAWGNVQVYTTVEIFKES